MSNEIPLTTISLNISGAVATVALQRPDAANARNQAMRNELSYVWTLLASRTDIHVVVLTAAGDRFFCAGMDLKESVSEETSGERRDRLRSSRDIEQLASLPQPTIAAINGYALGGGFEMALACDIRIISEDAQMGLTELAHGLVPGGGGTQRLPRLIGHARAAEMLFLGLKISGRDAVQWGIANKCVSRSELVNEAQKLASEIAKQPRRALVYGKELLRMSQETTLSTGVQNELDVLLTLLNDRQSN
jgi:enoyl-CoA hydratase/carnithine racemase